jgi:hypothetical protein
VSGWTTDGVMKQSKVDFKNRRLAGVGDAGICVLAGEGGKEAREESSGCNDCPNSALGQTYKTRPDLIVHRQALICLLVAPNINPLRIHEAKLLS